MLVLWGLILLVVGTVIFFGAWMTDTFAYFAGYFFGKHKLIADVSPKKTVEGAIGGIAGRMLLIYILYLVYCINVGRLNLCL